MKLHIEIEDGDDRQSLLVVQDKEAVELLRRAAATSGFSETEREVLRSAVFAFEKPRTAPRFGRPAQPIHILGLSDDARSAAPELEVGDVLVSCRELDKTLGLTGNKSWVALRLARTDGTVRERQAAVKERRDFDPTANRQATIRGVRFCYQKDFEAIMEWENRNVKV
jgi:hypothetical protein